MKIKRTIMLVFTLRVLVLNAGCSHRAELYESCDPPNQADEVGCSSPRVCDDGLYCESDGTCQWVNGAPPGSTSTAPPVIECTAFDDAAACGGDDEHLIYCDPEGNGPPSDCTELGVSSMYCCPFSPPCDLCDAGDTDASDVNEDDASDE